MTKGVSNEVNFPKLEEQILKRWKTEKTFEKSVERRRGSPRFVFYEGPPTANGRPGLHHVESRSFKDVMLRYKTMRGFFAPRRAGWDTHGLPVELEVEKQLGLKSKKDIEKFGIAKFNEECRKSVWKYQKEWEELTERAGVWLDTDNAYITYDTSYIETLWHIIQQFEKKGLLYKDYRVVPLCTRCGTPLSSHELAQGYRTVTDLAVTVKFEIRNSKFEIPANTYLLAWTTTPWTLPGNVALAVAPKVKYVLAKKGKEHYIVAQELARDLLGEHEEVKRFSGNELVGTKYEPLFSFKKGEKGKKIWEVVSASFVSTQEGTGIVHTAVAYGADDFELGKKENLAMLHMVTEQGKFVAEAKPFAGKFVKDADPLIVADLKKRNLLFKEEWYEHEYPFCWRCSTPLLYYAKESWFVNMQKVKSRLLSNNRKVNWIPPHLKEGRMGEWLKEVKDWAFSRERYWGTPLPVWECKSCEAREVVGSFKELISKQTSRNTYTIVRHGHSGRQEKEMMVSWPEKTKVELTGKGRKQVEKLAKQLKRKKVDLVVSSDLLRTKQTAQILGKELGLKVQYDKRLREVDVGKLNGKSVLSLARVWGKKGETNLEHYLRRFVDPMPGGEDWVSIQKRMYEAVNDLERKYKGRRIALVSHELPLSMLEGTVKGMSREEMIAFRNKNSIAPGDARELPFAHLPLNGEMEIDLHRPFVDEVELSCGKCKKGNMKRVKDVVDVWYDSGAMPFAQGHWPFERRNKKQETRNKLAPPQDFPADYIVEAIDQTRGWFYTLLAVSTLLGLGPSFKNVISLGHVLDEKGEKMSKSKGNVVSPWDMIGKYGVDAVRWYFFSVNRPWDPKLFAEKDLQATLRKFILTLWNSHVFFKTYGARLNLAAAARFSLARHVLDQWILSRLNSVTRDMTGSMDNYDITGAARSLENFVVEDLSLWYIRRSRPRFQNPATKKELEEASATLNYVLEQVSLLAAPFIPFLAEHVYQQGGVFKKSPSTVFRASVHWESWPKNQKKFGNPGLERDMERLRSLASKGLAARAAAGIRVRQPLASLKIQDTRYKIQSELLKLLKDELNVKEIIFDQKLKTDIELDTKLTPALLEEGMLRELLRHVQGMRKEAGYKPRDRVRLRYTGEAPLKDLVARHASALKKTGGITELREADRPKQVFDVEQEIEVANKKLWLGMRKI